MGERKGVNKYYPPDWTPEQGGINKYHGTHALRERARKLHMGILIIRFEMPYNIWCEGCKNHIGMGVRYNAEKKKIGMYYSTPVYQFRMKCHLCDNHFEIKTDPANLDYVIVSGARRQEKRWDPTQNEQVVPEDKAVSRKLASDSMFKLEHGVADTEKAKDHRPAIAKLQNQQEVWRDDYAANRRLRDIMRIKKKEEKNQLAEDKNLLAKGSLDISLLPKSDEDSRTAALLRLLPLQSPEEKRKERRDAIEKTSIFGVKRKLSDRQLRLLATPSLEGIIKKKKVEDDQISESEDSGEDSGDDGNESESGAVFEGGKSGIRSYDRCENSDSSGEGEGSGGRIPCRRDIAGESGTADGSTDSGTAVNVVDSRLPGGSGSTVEDESGPSVTEGSGLSFLCDYDSSDSSNDVCTTPVAMPTDKKSAKVGAAKPQLPNPFSSASSLS